MTRLGAVAGAVATGASCITAATVAGCPDTTAAVDSRWAVYLIECGDGRVYTGIARDPEQRYVKHLSGKGARFTRSNPPKQMLGWIWVDDHGSALRLEIAWKKLPRAQRIAALQACMTCS